MSDDFFDTIDPYEYMLMYNHYIEDKQEEFDMLRQQGILIGSFTNFEAAKNMIKMDNPDYVNTEFDKPIQDIEQPQEEKPKRRKKRKILK